MFSKTYVDGMKEKANDSLLLREKLRENHSLDIRKKYRISRAQHNISYRGIRVLKISYIVK